MNNKPLPSRFSVKPLAFLIPIASLSLASAYVTAATGLTPITGQLTEQFVVPNGVSDVTIAAGGSIITAGEAALLIDGLTTPVDEIIIEAGGAIIAGTGSSTLAGTGIQITNGAAVGSITNAGVISGQSYSGAGGAVIVNNNATLGSLNNSGSVSGDIKIVGGGEVTAAIDNLNGGLINGSIIVGSTYSGFGDGAAVLSSVGSLTNNGSINGDIEIIEGSSVSGAINNGTGGIINGGIRVSGGTYSSSFGGATAIISSVGSLSNSGDINGDVDIVNGAQINGAFDNSGLLDGDITVSGVARDFSSSLPSASVSSSLGFLANSGTINGGVNITDGARIGGGIGNSGKIDGTVTIGGSATFSSYSGVTIFVPSAIGTLTNSGEITGGIEIASGIVEGNIEIIDGGQVASTINNGKGGLINGNIIVSGSTYSGSAGVVYSSVGSISNSGDINGSINISDGAQVIGVIDNSGAIGGSYTSAGIMISNGANVGNVTNSGIINGINNFGPSGGDAIVVNNATLGSLSNSGAGFFEPQPLIGGDGFELIGPPSFDGFGIIDGNILISNGGQVTGAIDNSGEIRGKVIVDGFSLNGGAVVPSVGSLTNSGVIGGIQVSEGAKVVGAIDNSGLIGDSYSGVGIEIFRGAEVGSVTNSGVVSGSGFSPSGPSGSIAIVVSDATLGSLTNSGPGFFTQDGIAFSGDGSELAPGNGLGLIDGDILILGGAEVTGVIENSGVISGNVIVEGTSFNGKGGDSTSVGSLANSGFISGIQVSEGARVVGAIDNSGLIGAEGFFGGSPGGNTYSGAGFSGAGITISSGAEVGSVTNSGVVSGSAFSPSGPSGLAAIVVSNATLGSLTNNAPGAIGPGFIDGDIDITNGGQVTGAIDNSGEIRGSVIVSGATYSGMGGASADTSVGSIVNSGQIFGGIEVSDGATVIGAIANDGLIVADSYSGGATITISSGANVGSLANSGEIGGDSYSGAPAIMISSGAELGSLTNSGLIQAESYSGNGAVAITISSGAEVGSLTNTGTIDDGIEGDIQVSNGGQVTGAINNSGRITGSVSVSGATSSGEGGAPVYSSIGSLVNSGVIKGGVSVSDGAKVLGAIDNQGLIQSDSYSGGGAAITISNGAKVASLSNSGVVGNGIEGDIEILSGGQVSGAINNFGRITGSVIVDSFTSRGTFVASSVGSIVNDGDIEGNIQISGGSQVAGEISNSGSIEGNIDVSNSSSSTASSPTSIGSLVNTGTIGGEVYISGGAEVKGNVFNSELGKISGGISFEDGSTFGGDIENAGVITVSDSSEGFDSGRAAINIDAGNSEALNAAATIDIQGKILNRGEISNTADAASLEMLTTVDLGIAAKPSALVTDPAAIYLNNVNLLGGIQNENLISSASGSGIRVENGSVNIIVNNGIITGGNDYAIFIDDTASVAEINNTGTINGMVDFGTSGGLFNTLGGTSGSIINATSLKIGAATSGDLGPLANVINGSLNFSGDLTFQANGSEEGVRYGQLDVRDDADINGSLTINVSGETFFDDLDELELIKSGGTLTTDIIDADTNSLLLEFSIEQRASSLFATVAREETATVVEELFRIVEVADESGVEFVGSAGANNVLEVAAELDRLITSGAIPEDSELGVIIASLQGEDDPVALVRAIRSLQPEAGGGSREGSAAAAGAVSAVIATRQGNLRATQNDSYETGMVAGDDIAITGFWIQGYDKDTEQEVRNGVDGYDLDMYGLALGADAPINERTTVGVAISYADSQVDSTGFNDNEMSIDSYQISSYVSFNEDDYYLDALVSYARNEYEGKRNLTTGLTSTSDYAGDQYGLRARGGYPFVLESGIHITPNTSVEYSYLKEESYQEEGAGTASIGVASETLEALVWAAGVKVSYPFTTESDVTWMPDFHMEVRHDFIGDEVELDSNFVGVGGAGFSTDGGSVETTAYKAGIGLRAWSQSSVSFMFRYDYTYKKDYNSQAVAATMRYSF